MISTCMQYTNCSEISFPSYKVSNQHFSVSELLSLFSCRQVTALKVRLYTDGNNLYFFICIIIAVQILFVEEREHWVASSATYESGRVRLYDSCSTGVLTKTLEIHLAQIYKEVAKDRMLDVDIVSVQQQKGTTDCGVYSIANAFNAAIGKDVEKITYNNEKMREHLQNCFEERCIRNFPEASNERVPRCEAKQVTIKLYCVCALPKTYDNHMVQCDTCDELFHFCCMAIKTKPQGSWICINCRH